jgi:hypothetical protein
MFRCRNVKGVRLYTVNCELSVLPKLKDIWKSGTCWWTWIDSHVNLSLSLYDLECLKYRQVGMGSNSRGSYAAALEPSVQYTRVAGIRGIKKLSLYKYANSGISVLCIYFLHYVITQNFHVSVRFLRTQHRYKALQNKVLSVNNWRNGQT